MEAGGLMPGLPFIPSHETAQKLREMVAYIRERGRAMRFDMDNFAIPERCGTVCCLAGFIAEKEGVLPEVKDDSEIFGRDLMYTTVPDNGYPLTIAKFAMQYLGGGDVSKLFYVSDWPVQFNVEYHRANGGPAKLDVLEQRIEHYISTGY
jgi:hypothetical protein